MTLTMTLLLVKNRQPFQYSNYYTFWWACQSGGGSIYNQHFTMWTWDVFSVWSFRWGYIVWYLISISTQRAVKVQVAGNFLRGVHSNSLLLALRLIFLLAPLGVFADLMTPWFFPPPPHPPSPSPSDNSACEHILGELPYKKGQQVLVIPVPFRGWKGVFYTSRCPAWIRPQWELLRCLLGYWAEKNKSGWCIVLELMPLRGEKIQATPTEQDLDASYLGVVWKFLMGTQAMLFILEFPPSSLELIHY